MLTTITELPGGIDGVKAVGKVSKEDYERLLEPLVDQARRAGRRLRFLYELGPEFEGFTPGGAWEDVKLGLRSLRRFEGCAVVSDLEWIRASSRLAASLMPCPVRVFGTHQRWDAVEWLQSLPEGPGVYHHLDPQSGVLVVEVQEPLRAEDFGALAITADSWLERHRSLRGLVIHAHEFPGWENIGAFLGHVRFVRDHHRKIDRVALAADSALATIVPRLAEHFVAAEVRHFAYDELEKATAWAAGESPRSVADTAGSEARASS